MYFLIGAALAAAAVSALSLPSLRGWRVVWQIGQFDGSPAEFALAPSGAREFAKRFPTDPVFKVGESQPAQWPFIHPNEADTAWGGAPQHTFRVEFPLTARPRRDLGLLIALADVHERLAPEMVISVNGHPHRRRLRPGAGRAYYGDIAGGRPQTVWVTVPRQQLRAGNNEVAITLTSGSWVAYDALALVERQLAPPRRRPTAETHAFVLQCAPLHQNAPGLPSNWRGDVLVTSIERGWVYVMGQQGQELTWPAELECQHFLASMDVQPLQGQMMLEFSIDDAAEPYWQVAFDEQHAWLVGADAKETPGPGPWRLTVISSPTETVLQIRSLTHKWAVETLPVLHSHGASGRLRLRVASDVAQAYVTNMMWTAPVAIRAVEHPSADGRQAIRVDLTAPRGRGDGLVRLVAMTPELDRLSTRTFTWPGDHEQASVTLRPRRGQRAELVRFELVVPRKRRPRLAFSVPVQKPRAQRQPAPRPAGAYAVGTDGGLVVGNAAYEITLPPDESQGPIDLVERRSGRVLADRPYSYTFAGKPLRVARRQVEREPSGAVAVELTLQAEGLRVRHRIVFPPDHDGFAERFYFEVTAPQPIDLTRWRAGWLRSLEDLPADAETLIPVPWRRDTHANGELLDMTPAQAAWQTGWYRTDGTPRRVTVAEHGSEGWLWHHRDGGTLMAKYNPDFMEWCLIDRMKQAGELLVRFGGSGAWHDDPERWKQMEPGSKTASGWTYYIAYVGPVQQGFYAFRRLMEHLVHGCPPNFNPPLHWNELYDNPLWWGPDTPERRQKYYRLEDMVREAEKAAATGCQALYLDPGWDTVFGSHLWAEDRLGPVEDFVRLMRQRYGLAVSLHTPMADWASAGGGGRTYPPEAWRVDENGRVMEGRLCSGARAYIEEEVRRLIRLADAGVVYFMFDGSRYTGPCFSRHHGHQVPYTRDDHVAALRKIAQLIHRKHPEVIIEQHDQVVAGVHSVYVPIYLGHGNGGWTERWANEYMWQPLKDLIDGRARSLYYYNLAYSLPLYIHIDLRNDNQNCLAFWWYASTCRHLGIGGTHPDGRNWLQVQRAMRQYLRLQDFFKRGTFLGLDEETHLHVLPSRGAVLNVFNLSAHPKKWERVIDLAEIGVVKAGQKVRVRVHGASSTRRGTAVRLRVDLDPWDARVVEIAVQ